ncbi:MAG: hypothetical protein DWQ42_17475 [Planctomycetota bacterium]|nr:MAG: hypothetical protein DWQ42_17475 [Planctomycetota bacterium]REK41043.1 MAG: hypothetical protein DWQ46_14460 [Planctomycetota bacterium]
MTNTWILVGVIILAFVAAAAGAYFVARRTPDARQRRSIQGKVVLFLVVGLALAGYAFLADTGLRKTTLHEVVLDGMSAEGGSILRVAFDVEHPNVEHDLMIGPMFPTPSLRFADFEVELAATLTADQGSPLIDEEFTFKPRSRDTAWHPAYLKFTPTVAGPHTLTLQLRTPNTPAVHVRIADPLKTDGQRAPGY